MKNITDILTFELDKKTYAFNSEDVYRIIPVIKIEKLYDVPEKILGIIKLHEKIIPIIDIRKSLKLLPKRIELSDKIVILKYEERYFGVIVDNILNNVKLKEKDYIPNDSIWEHLEGINGIALINDSIVLINNLKMFLNSDENEILTEAVNNLTENPE